MSMVNHVCWKELTEQVCLHCYEVITYPDELVLELPQKNPGSAYDELHLKYFAANYDNIN